MRNKLYLAVLCVMSGTVAIDVGAEQDRFNNAVGTIGVTAAQSDLFSNPVATIAAPPNSAPVNVDVVGEKKIQIKRSSLILNPAENLIIGHTSLYNVQLIQ